MADPLPGDAESLFLCLSGRGFMIIHGVFTTEDKADTWASCANEWYGDDHPLTPIRVEPVKKDIRPFPAAQMRAVVDAGADNTEALAALFSTLVDDPPEPPPLDPAPPEPLHEGQPDPQPTRGGRRA